MSRITAFFCALIFASAISLTARAQSVYWNPSGGSLAKGQTTQLQLVFENCKPTSTDISKALVSGLELQATQNVFTNMTSVNGRTTTSTSYGINARPTVDGSVTIPAFTVETDKGKITVSSVTFQIGAATVQGGALALDQVVSSQIIIPQKVHAGYVFPVTYKLSAMKRYLASLGSEHPEWDSSPLTAEPWPKYQVSEEMRNGEPWINVTYTTRALVRTPGTVKLQPAKQIAVLNTGRAQSGFDSIFGIQSQEQFTITSDQPQIIVMPLPANAPKSFAGAVGKFKLESKVVPENASVGEPVTWTLALSGDGNWPDVTSLPPRAVSKDFRTIQPQAKRSTGNSDNSLFSGTLTEDVVLIPTKPGRYTIGPIVWSFLNQETGDYETITTPATTLDIAPSANASATAAFAGSSAGNTGSTAGGSASLATPPKTPSSIPGDPLPSASPVREPLPISSLFGWLLVAALWPLVLWLVFALIRARRTDPNRPQREARDRLFQILAQLDNTPASESAQISSLLQSWQHHAAVLWKIPHVVPSASLFLDARDKQMGSTWSALWADSERTLYRSGTALPADWVSRANQALAAKRVSGFNPLSLFCRRNLFPLAAAIAVAFVSLALPSSIFGATNNSQTPEALYRSGDFSGAEKVWRKEAASTPGNWSARYNLSLALAQQDRLPEAAAHAVSAFVQKPGDDAVSRNVLLMLERAGYSPTAVGDVMRGGPVREVAFALSPTQWQCALGCALSFAALAVAILLVRSYVRRWRTALAATAIILEGIAVIGVLVAALSLHAYGPARDPRAVIVWKTGALRSIPTVADTTQKTTPLSAGTIAVADKDFPGWIRLVFENGQTGWLPKEDVVALWR